MPQCATCEEYISPDFVRVFGDNDRIVRSCLSCHGNRPEPEITEAPREMESAEQVEEIQDAPSTDMSTDDAGMSAALGGDSADDAAEVEDIEDVAETPADAFDSVEPETPVTGPGRSGLEFLRSVFLR